MTVHKLENGDLLVTDSLSRMATLHWSRFHGLIVNAAGAVYLGEPEVYQWLMECMAGTGGSINHERELHHFETEQAHERALAVIDEALRIVETRDGLDNDAVFRQLRGVLATASEPTWEYGIARLASMPDMSGRDQYTLIVSTTFPTREAAEEALARVPSLRSNPAVIVRARARGEWHPVGGVL